MTPDELKNPTIQRAILLGTYGKPDRAKQYDAPHESQPARLLKAVNAQGDHIRHVQRDVTEMRTMMDLKLRNTIIAIAVTAVLARAPEIWSWLMRITQ